MTPIRPKTELIATSTRPACLVRSTVEMESDNQPNGMTKPTILKEGCFAK